jgi:hypothetical protein
VLESGPEKHPKNNPEQHSRVSIDHLLSLSGLARLGCGDVPSIMQILKLNRILSHSCDAPVERLRLNDDSGMHNRGRRARADEAIE